MLGFLPTGAAPIAATSVPVLHGITPTVGVYTSAFFAIEATIAQSFVDPVGPAAYGILGTPNLGLSQYELVPSTTTTMRASDSGYRSKSTDSIGVKAFPPTIAEAFAVDIAANLDPTKTAVAAAWGTLTLNNLDGAYDTLAAGGQNDGNAITIYRGVKTWDSSRQIWLDPAYASLVPVFVGVMGPWIINPTTLSVALRDASYNLETAYPRTLFTGAGGYGGVAALVNSSQPFTFGGTPTGTHYLQNVTPIAADPASLIYRFSDRAGWVGAVYDGGVALASGGVTTDLYTGTTIAGQYRADVTRGLFQLGSTPTFNVTADVAGDLTYSATTVSVLTLAALTTLGLTTAQVGGFGTGAIETRGVDATATAATVALLTGLYLASGDDATGVDFIERLLTSCGGYLVPCRDGKLRIFVLAPPPTVSTPVLALDDSNIITLEPAALPATINPPVSRMRIYYNRNWTVQTTGIAGAVSATRQAFLSAPGNIATAVPTISVGSPSRLSDPAIIGPDGGSLDTTGTASQTIIANMVKVFGVRRRIYEVTVPASVGMTLDWGSIVSLTSDFDGLDAGVLGQIVGWSYASGAATQLLRVFV